MNHGGTVIQDAVGYTLPPLGSTCFICHGLTKVVPATMQCNECGRCVCKDHEGFKHEGMKGHFCKGCFATPRNDMSKRMREALEEATIDRSLPHFWYNIDTKCHSCSTEIVRNEEYTCYRCDKIFCSACFRHVYSITFSPDEANLATPRDYNYDNCFCRSCVNEHPPEDFAQIGHRLALVFHCDVYDLNSHKLAFLAKSRSNTSDRLLTREQLLLARE